MLIKLNNKNKQKGNNMTYEQKKFEGYTEGQMAREILMYFLNTDTKPILI